MDKNAALAKALAEESAKSVGEQAIEKYGDGLVAEAHGGQGNPDDVILATAVEVGADLIVVGSKGMQRRYLGSVPNSVAHGAQLRRAGRQDRTALSHGRRTSTPGTVFLCGRTTSAAPIAESYDTRRVAHVRPGRRRRHGGFPYGFGRGRCRFQLESAPAALRCRSSARGVPVHGIDLSPDMGRRSPRAKPGAADIDVTIGDFATTSGAGNVPPGLPRLQHHRESHEPGRSGRMFHQRRAAPRTGRLFRH